MRSPTAVSSSCALGEDASPVHPASASEGASLNSCGGRLKSMLTDTSVPLARPWPATAHTASDSTESMLQAAMMHAGADAPSSAASASPAGSDATLQPFVSRNATIGATRCRSTLS